MAGGAVIFRDSTISDIRGQENFLPPDAARGLGLRDLVTGTGRRAH